MRPIETVLGRAFKLPGDFLLLLDRNFRELSKETAPYAVDSAYNFATTDQVDSLQVDATSAAISVLLPDQPNGNRRRRVQKTDASANAVTVDGNGNTINGATTYVLNARYEFVEVEPDGSNWLVIAYG